MMIVNKKEVFKRFLNEETYKALRYGFLAIYKRPGLTAAVELEDLKTAVVKGMTHDMAVSRKAYLLRAGHGGNLDSMATGVLGVAFCDGCKLLPHLLSSSKRYTVTGQLGVATDTYNNVGKMTLQLPFDHVTRKIIEDALTEFVGEIFQKPPPYSALKIQGQRASDIVRSGGTVKLVPRPVVCHTAKLVSFEPPYFTLDVSCGQGFYIRSLVHDLAEAIGTCANVTSLERTKHGPFTLKDCLQATNFSTENIISAVKEARKNHPKLAHKLDSYWSQNETDSMKKKTKIEPEKVDENRFVEDYTSFVKVKNREESSIKDKCL